MNATSKLAVLAGAMLAVSCSGGQDEDVSSEVNSLFAQGFANAVNASEDDPTETAISSRPPSSFTPDPGVRRAIAGEMADNLRRNFSLEFALEDPEQFISSGAAGDIGDRNLEMLGLPLHDMGSASVLLFGLAWELANQQPLTPAQQKGLIQQVAKDLTSIPEDEASRQREADSRLLIAALWLEEARLRRGSPERMQALSDAVQRDMQRLSGNDMRGHDLGEGGFIER